MPNEIIETGYFRIYFSRDKKGNDNFKFKPYEKETILKAIKNVEDIFSLVLDFSRTPLLTNIYHIPIIFEKVTKQKFEAKHQNHYAFLYYPPIGSMWNKTVKFEGIEIKSKTAIILMCPMNQEDIFETICHEVVHAFYDSFMDSDGVNHTNEKYFLEGLTEWFAQLANKRYTNKSKNYK